MKQTLLTLLIFTTSFNAFSQNEFAGGVIIDGKFLGPNDSIKCYSFKTLQIAFPITEQLFSHDMIGFRFSTDIGSYSDEDRNEFYSSVWLTQKEFSANFAGKKIGVVTILDTSRGDNKKQQTLFFKSNYRDDNSMAISCEKLGTANIPYSYFADKLSNNKNFDPKIKLVSFEILASDITGYKEYINSDAGTIEKKPIYSKSIYKYKYGFKLFNQSLTIVSNWGIYTSKEDYLERSETDKAAWDEANKKPATIPILGISVKKKKEAKTYTYYDSVEHHNNMGEKAKSCKPIVSGKPANVIMNTNIDLYTWYGYIK